MAQLSRRALTIGVLARNILHIELGAVFAGIIALIWSQHGLMTSGYFLKLYQKGRLMRQKLFVLINQNLGHQIIFIGESLY